MVHVQYYYYDDKSARRTYLELNVKNCRLTFIARFISERDLCRIL